MTGAWDDPSPATRTVPGMVPCLVCGEPSKGSRCDEHRKPSATGRGRRWTELSRRMRRRQPWCEICLRSKEEVEADGEGLEVDHIVPLFKGGAMYDPANLRVVCGPCNRRAQRDELWGRGV